MMTTDASKLRQARSLAEVDIDALIRSAHLERNRVLTAKAVSALGALKRNIRHHLQIVPRVLPVK